MGPRKRIANTILMSQEEGMCAQERRRFKGKITEAGQSSSRVGKERSVQAPEHRTCGRDTAGDEPEGLDQLLETFTM